MLRIVWEAAQNEDAKERLLQALEMLFEDQPTKLGSNQVDEIALLDG
jgi:hypothetical protein